MFMRKVVSKESSKYPISFDVVRFVSAPFSASCYLISWNQRIHLFALHNRYKGQTRCFDDWKAKLFKHPSTPWQVKLNMKCCFQVSWSIHCLNKHKTKGQNVHGEIKVKEFHVSLESSFQGCCPTRINYLHPRPWWEVVILKSQLLSIAHDNLWFHIQLHFVVVWCGMVIGFSFLFSSKWEQGWIMV